MFLCEFSKMVPCPCEEEGCPGTEESHRVLVFDESELIQLINYTREYEYHLETVIWDNVCIGLDDFKSFQAQLAKDKEENNGQ